MIIADIKLKNAPTKTKGSSYREIKDRILTS